VQRIELKRFSYGCGGYPAQEDLQNLKTISEKSRRSALNTKNNNHLRQNSFAVIEGSLFHWVMVAAQPGNVVI
jgi:hypothetical protein